MAGGLIGTQLNCIALGQNGTGIKEVFGILAPDSRHSVEIQTAPATSPCLPSRHRLPPLSKPPPILRPWPAPIAAAAALCGWGISSSAPALIASARGSYRPPCRANSCSPASAQWFPRPTPDEEGGGRHHGRQGRSREQQQDHGSPVGVHQLLLQTFFIIPGSRCVLVDGAMDWWCPAVQTTMAGCHPVPGAPRSPASLSPQLAALASLLVGVLGTVAPAVAGVRSHPGHRQPLWPARQRQPRLE